MMKQTACILLVFGIVACFGCKRSTTLTGPKGEKVTVTRDGAKVEGTAKGPHGEEVRWAAGEGGVALPDDFPKDVAIYPDAKPLASTSDKKHISVTLKTADPSEKVAAFYKDRLKADGWEIEQTMNMGAISMVHAAKGGRKATVSVNNDSDQTIVTIVVESET
jgi:hypothetical protein